MEIVASNKTNDDFTLLIKFRNQKKEFIEEWFDIEDIDVLIRDLKECKEYLKNKLGVVP